MLGREDEVKNDIYEYLAFTLVFFFVFMLPVVFLGDESAFGAIKRSSIIQSIYESYRCYFRVGLYPLYFVFAYYFFKDGHRLVLKAYLTAQAVLFFLVAYPMKVMVGKARPLYGFYRIGFSFSDKFHSFPSGHACDAFCSAAFLVCCFSFSKRVKYFILLYAGFISCTRVVLHRHYLSDVAFGALFGAFISIMFIYFWVLPKCIKNTAKT